MSEHSRDLSSFTLAGYDKGRPRWVQVAWVLVSNTVFMAWFCPGRLRVLLLRAFGAKVAEHVLVRHRVRILWPWKLLVGENTWIGEGAWLLNLEPISLGSNVCISQEAFLCTGSHDYKAANFKYRNAPIHIEDGGWVAARATVLPGVTVGAQSVISAGCVVSRNVAAHTVVSVTGMDRSKGKTETERRIP